MQEKKDYKKFIGFWTIEGKITHNEKIGMFIMMCGFILLTYFGIGGHDGFMSIFDYYYNSNDFPYSVNWFDFMCSIISSFFAFVFFCILFGFELE
jgi:hypothetical protein